MSITGPPAPPLDTTWTRAQFPALGRTGPNGQIACHLDGPGGTQVPATVIDAMRDYLVTSNANLGGEFPPTRASDELVARARRYGGVFVGGDPGCVTFGQNMTTLNFLLTRAFGRTLRPGDEIITTTLDHDANVSPWLLLAEDLGLTVRQVAVTDEELTLDLDDLRDKIGPRTRVVAYTLASNAVGTLTPSRQVADLAHEAGALAWVDAVHYATHRRIDVQAIGCDVLLCSPYKFYGPHMGMAWMRPGLAEQLPAERVRPASQEPPGHRFETGTLSHEALAGFVAAIDYLAGLGTGSPLADRLTSAFQAITAHEHQLAERFLHRIGDVAGVRLLGVAGADPSRRVATFGLAAQRTTPAALARGLGERGIYAWNGDFYALNVVRELGLEAGGILRLGFVHYNTNDEVDRAVDALTELCGGNGGRFS